ncbi:MAG: hypothetical protein A3H91_16200 [Gammaproteobacteria bacterium RIFCSPLOWO2_02_FULL_61_13]|nr:MAG: hypothetical protein A3H91_16200 [Gammaproteobacteria bacterium RIFCSPLOWO2_02_FULL_61_13]
MGAAHARATGAAKSAIILAMFAAMTFPTTAAETKTIAGLWLTTDFPAMAVRAGETTTVKIKLQNAELPPQRVALTVSGIPQGWKATVLGGGVPVAAAMPATNESVALQLRIEVPAGAQKGSQRVLLAAKGNQATAELPLDIIIGQSLPPRLSLKSKLPSQRGSARTSFEYPITVHNESDKDALVKLAAQAPQGFQSTFTEGFGSQEISSIPIEAGQSKELKVKVQPSDATPAGDYPLTVSASVEGTQAVAQMAIQITGAPKLRITTEDGRLSGEAEAGKPTPLNVVIENTGSAPAAGVTLSASPPGDWKIDIEPRQIPLLAPGQKLPVQAIVTPSGKAIAGDYMATLRANSGSESASADFRLSVTTSTLWGMAGILVIVIALLLSVGAVARFGRR